MAVRLPDRYHGGVQNEWPGRAVGIKTRWPCVGIWGATEAGLHLVCMV